EILTGTNTYTGGTQLAGGTLQLGAGGTTGSIVGPVVNNGLLIFNRSNAVVFDSAVSGTGAISKVGDNTLTLPGNSAAFGGVTTVYAGTLAVHGAVGGTLDVRSG